jgi:retinol-binding protein 3
LPYFYHCPENETLFMEFKKNLLCIAFILAAGTLAFAQPATAQKPVSVKILVDSLDRALHRIYIFPDKSKVMGDYIKEQLRKGAYRDITDPKQLAGRLGSDLQAAHKDGHLRIHYDPGFTARAAASRQSGPPDMEEALRQSREENFSFKKLEILDGNIGYVEFQGFNGFVDEAKPTISAAFGFLANTNAIIIDLRRNGGGSPPMVKYIASYFYKERTRLNDIYERRRNKTMEFWAEPEAAGNMKLSMPLYILTSKHTFSAAEDFSYAMQVNKRATIVGDTTGGGAHPTGPVDVGQGFVIDIPFARSINHITKTDWEGTGVLPDVAVTADRSLATAQALALNAQLADAKTDAQKKQIGWSLNALKAHGYDKTVDVAMLRKYAGEYGRFSISLKDDQLSLHDNKRVFSLLPITGSVFLAADWLQVEFITRDDGKVAMKFIGKSWEDIYEKMK